MINLDWLREVTVRKFHIPKTKFLNVRLLVISSAAPSHPFPQAVLLKLAVDCAPLRIFVYAIFKGGDSCHLEQPAVPILDDLTDELVISNHYLILKMRLLVDVLQYQELWKRIREIFKLEGIVRVNCLES